MRIAYETTLKTHDGKDFTDIFPDPDMAENHGKYRLERWPLKYSGYTVKEIVV